MTLNDDELHRYARQLVLPDMDETGQERLKAAHVLVVGAGGLGAPLILYLAAAGIGHITIMDGDVVEKTNLNRQICFTDAEHGKPKAETASAMAGRLNPSIRLDAVNDWLTDENASLHIRSGSIVADATDRPASRLLINRYCHDQKAVMVFAGAVRLEGQLAAFASGIDETKPCFICAFPETNADDMTSRCTEAGILGAITGIMGSLMALEVLRQCLKPAQPFGDDLSGKLLLYDGRDGYMHTINLQKRPDCPVCGNHRRP